MAGESDHTTKTPCTQTCVVAVAAQVVKMNVMPSARGRVPLIRNPAPSVLLIARLPPDSRNAHACLPIRSPG